MPRVFPERAACELVAVCPSQAWRASSKRRLRDWLQRIKRCRQHVWQVEPGVSNLDYEPMEVGKWYHTDETQADVYGPFDTMVQAVIALENYCRHYLGE